VNIWWSAGLRSWRAAQNLCVSNAEGFCGIAARYQKLDVELTP